MPSNPWRAVRSKSLAGAAAILVLLLLATPAAAQELASEDGPVPPASAQPDQSGAVDDVRTQADVRARYGNPEAFAVLYFDEIAVDGTVSAMSTSQWSYYADGVEFTFADGQVTSEDSIALQPGATAEPVPYDPDQFRAYMTLEEVLESAGLNDYMGGPIDGMVEGGELFFADRLTWGTKDGELRYIEALALDAKGANTEDE